MTNSQVGLFIRLLCFQWQEGPLTSDEVKLKRMTQCEIDSDLVEVLKKFPENRNGMRANKRLERIRKEREKFCKSRSINGMKGGRPKNLVLSTSLPSANLRESLPLPFPLPFPNNNTEGGNEHDLSLADTLPTAPARKTAKSSEPSPAFLAFWAAYPRKTAKPVALKAWSQIKGDRNAAEIMAGLKRFEFSDNPQFIPHPATWLRGHRWTDEPAAASQAEEKFIY